MRRREFLASGVAASGLLSVPQVTASERSFEETYNQALKIREETGSRERFLHYLRKHANVVNTNKRRFIVSREEDDDDGVSTQKIKTGSISVAMTLTYEIGCPDGDSYAYADYEFSVDSIENGEKGPDHISLSWNADHYRIVDYGWYSADNSPNLNYNASQLNGIDWEWIDDTACGTAGCNIDGKYVGTKMELLNTDQERAVRGEWRHTWSETDYSGFGVSTGGAIVFSSSPAEHSWEGKYRTKEDAEATKYEC
jgi:hypothetical protein